MFILIIVLAIIPRFIAIDKVPNAINQDELHYTLDAKSFFLTGKDVLGQTSPMDVLLFNFPKSDPLQAELQYFLEIPIFGLMGFSMLNLVLPNAILSVLTVAMIYLVTAKLFNKNAALVAGLVAVINPWLIFVGRTTYEAGPATLFFLCVFYLLLVTRNWKILLTIPIALLAFYSYIGTKLIFLPFMLVSVAYAYLYVNKRKYLKQYSLVLLFSLILTLFFVFQFQRYDVSRNSELLLPNNPEITRQVIELRKGTLQNPLLDLFDNKMTVYTMVLVKNTFNVFSPSYLFVNADYFFMMGGQGLFYYLDVIFLIIGLGFVFLRNRKLFLTLLAIIFMGALPQIFHNPKGDGNFSPHIALLIPFLIILIGVGLSRILEMFKQKKLRYALIIVVGILYIAAFTNFSYFYFFKFPLQGGVFETQNRILAKYLSLYKSNVPITIYSTNRKYAYKEFLFYTNNYNKNTVGQINNSLRNEKFVFNSIKFMSCDDNIKETKSVVIEDMNCSKLLNLGAVEIAQLKDSGIRYFIYNDQICNKYGPAGYISNLKLSDFAMESLSQKRFCEAFIISR